MTDEKDFYRVLGVSAASEQEVIEAAYRALMRKYHPDRNTGNTEAPWRARAINEAYDVLSDPEKRREYDRQPDRPKNIPARYTRDTNWHERGSSDYQAAEAPLLKRCIDCAEEIQRGARVCRYCSARQDEGQKAQSQRTNIHTHVYPTAPPPPPPQMRAKRSSGVGLLILVLLVLLLIILF